uniref:Fibronectin type-III domain-containing protein n=1 Tax=Monopterus albus TaxID=43700 RepID=A0A3Q3K6Z2_MONAL
FSQLTAVTAPQTSHFPPVCGVTPHNVPSSSSTCAPNCFHCGSGACIINTWVCDGYADCPDGSDEFGCPTGGVTPHNVPSSSSTCAPNCFHCGSGVCIINTWVCDGYADCPDGSDEFGCPTATRGHLFCINSTRCSDGEACVPDSERCDGFLDCSDHSDEDNCTSDFLAYKVQNLQWTPDFLGAITLTWSHPKNFLLDLCYFLIYYRLKGSEYFLKLCIFVCAIVPDPPRNLQLSCDNSEDGKVQVSWTAPDKGHSLIREYIVSIFLCIKLLYGSLVYVQTTAAKSVVTLVKQYIVILSWQFDTHIKESKNYTVREGILKATNLTAGTVYEVAVWAHTSIGDSPTALSHHQTTGTQPDRPLLKARALNQTAVDCSWTISGHPVYGVFYATSFLDLYRSPRLVHTTSLSLTVTVDSDEQYLFLVRAVSPFLGPPSDYTVVKMIPNERLPPRNLHRVRVDKMQATLKWQPPYDAPNTPLTYAIHVRDVIRKVEQDYKLTTQNNTVEYLLKGLEPAGRYSVSVRLRNMSKEASFTLSTVPLSAPEALKILTEKDHVFLFWKSLAVREKGFNESRGYEVHVYDSVTNQTAYLGNTTETYFRISNLMAGHNYTFSVQARCLLNSQLCGEPALLLYNQLTAGTGAYTHLQYGHSGDMAAVVVPILFLLLLAVCGVLVALYLRHRRLQNNFTAFANSHYNSRLGSAIFSSGDELGKKPFPFEMHVALGKPCVCHLTLQRSVVFRTHQWLFHLVG